MDGTASNTLYVLVSNFVDSVIQLPLNMQIATSMEATGTIIHPWYNEDPIENDGHILSRSQPDTVTAVNYKSKVIRDDPIARHSEAEVEDA